MIVDIVHCAVYFRYIDIIIHCHMHISLEKVHEMAFACKAGICYLIQGELFSRFSCIYWMAESTGVLGLQQVLKGLGDFSGQKKDQFINIEVGNGDVIDLVIVHLIGDPLDAGQKLRGKVLLQILPGFGGNVV